MHPDTLTNKTIDLGSNTLTGSVAEFNTALQSETFAYIGVSNSWGDGVKQTFNPNGTNAGINVGSHAGDNSSPANGDIHYNSTSNALRAYINGAYVSLAAGVPAKSSGMAYCDFRFIVDELAPSGSMNPEIFFEIVVVMASMSG